VEKLVGLGASLDIFQDIITRKFCNLVGHLKDLEGGCYRMLEVTSMSALTVKGVQELLPSSPPSKSSVGYCGLAIFCLKAPEVQLTL